ncbi:MAG: hypothetical protein H7328_09560 [Bdellovibrio sp.]|nr:hypothetical protein [Bdellovibrio sp.]
MRSVELLCSETKIDKAGELLKSKSVSSVEKLQALEILFNWRAIHTIITALGIPSAAES